MASYVLPVPSKRIQKQLVTRFVQEQQANLDERCNEFSPKDVIAQLLVEECKMKDNCNAEHTEFLLEWRGDKNNEDRRLLDTTNQHSTERHCEPCNDDDSEPEIAWHPYEALLWEEHFAKFFSRTETHCNASDTTARHLLQESPVHQHQSHQRGHRTPLNHSDKFSSSLHAETSGKAQDFRLREQDLPDAAATDLQRRIKNKNDCLFDLEDCSMMDNKLGVHPPASDDSTKQPRVVWDGSVSMSPLRRFTADDSKNKRRSSSDDMLLSTMTTPHETPHEYLFTKTSVHRVSPGEESIHHSNNKTRARTPACLQQVLEFRIGGGA